MGKPQSTPFSRGQQMSRLHKIAPSVSTTIGCADWPQDSAYFLRTYIGT